MALCACVLGPVSADAQSGARHELARTSLTSVRAYVADDAIPAQTAAPPNVVVPDALRHVVDLMLRSSPTFRRQSQRIAAESLLTVHVTLALTSLPHGVHAVTTVTRHPDGRVLAHIAIAPLSDTVVLIAHEFEHVIEQIDGIDLAPLAALPLTGVRRERAMPHAFETVRATRVGRKVAGEVRQ